MSQFKEIVVYIHGVSHEAGSHAQQYELIHEGIRSYRGPEWPHGHVDVEWGWDRPNAGNRSERLLTKAQAHLGGRILEAMDAEDEPTLNPLRVAINKVRPLLIYRFADMFYYVSTDGKAAVRQVVADKIVDDIEQQIANADGAPVSLTLIAHSAGSVVAFDLLFYLFHKEAAAPGYEFLRDAGESSKGIETRDKLKELRAMAQIGQLRLRRLYTFGSPVAWTAVRNDEVVEILARGDQLNPLNYGLDPNSPGEPLAGPRWVNLWDKDDFAATPIEPLMDNALGVVEDVHMNVSWSITKAHDAYWDSSKVHKELAARW